MNVILSFSEKLSNTYFPTSAAAPNPNNIFRGFINFYSYWSYFLSYPVNLKLLFLKSNLDVFYSSSNLSFSSFFSFYSSYFSSAFSTFFWDVFSSTYYLLLLWVSAAVFLSLFFRWNLPNPLNYISTTLRRLIIIRKFKTRYFI